MGCKGSKHKSAAKDAVSPKKKSELTTTKAALEVIPETNDPGSCSGRRKEVKDITVNAEPNELAIGERKEIDEGKEAENVVSRGSPDLYFSPRKDDDAIGNIGADGGEYYPPRVDPAKGGKGAGVEAASKATEERQKADSGQRVDQAEDAGGRQEDVTAVSGNSSIEVADLKVPGSIKEVPEQPRAVLNQTLPVDIEISRGD